MPSRDYIMYKAGQASMIKSAQGAKVINAAKKLKLWQRVGRGLGNYFDLLLAGGDYQKTKTINSFAKAIEKVKGQSNFNRDRLYNLIDMQYHNLDNIRRKAMYTRLGTTATGAAGGLLYLANKGSNNKLKDQLNNATKAVDKGTN